MIGTHVALAALQTVSTTDDGLTLSEVWAELPHDPASIFTIVLLIVVFGGIFWAGRSKPPTAPGGAL